MNNNIYLSFGFRLLPSKKQHEALDRLLEDQRQLYNAALESRIDCYRKTGKGVSYLTQQKQLTELRKESEFYAVSVTLQRWTLGRLDEAFAGFFSRIKKGVTVGHPRFRGFGWWQSFGISQFTGKTFNGKALRFKGMPNKLRVHMTRQLPENSSIKSCVFTKTLKGWKVTFQCSVPVTEQKPCLTAVGLDLGLEKLAALSDGTLIPSLRAARRSERRIRILSRSLSRKKRGSNSCLKAKNSLSKAHEKIQNTRHTHLHQVSAALVRKYDTIVVEKLNIKGLSASMLAKPVRDASWSKLLHNIRYKAENAGGRMIEVDAAFTSQECPECGAVKKKTLAERVHLCPCGCVLDRDVAAARIILNRAVMSPGLLNVDAVRSSVQAERSIWSLN